MPGPEQGVYIEDRYLEGSENSEPKSSETHELGADTKKIENLAQQRNFLLKKILEEIFVPRWGLMEDMKISSVSNSHDPMSDAVVDLDFGGAKFRLLAKMNGDFLLVQNSTELNTDLEEYIGSRIVAWREEANNLFPVVLASLQPIDENRKKAARQALEYIERCGGVASNIAQRLEDPFDPASDILIDIDLGGSYANLRVPRKGVVTGRICSANDERRKKFVIPGIFPL